MIFEDFNSTSCVWVYLSNSSISEEKSTKILEEFNLFSNDWKSHGESVEGRLRIIDNHIVAIGANIPSDSICGRAVDAQVRFMKLLDDSMGYDFMNRNQLAFAQEKSIVVYDFGKISSLIGENKIDEKTPWCNTFLKTNEDELFSPFGYSPFAFSFFSK